MKRPLLCLVVALCAVSLVHADQTIRSLQQTLKDQGFYYGAVTGDKSAETTAAIRRYQIRNGLLVTGEINEETLRSVQSNSHSVASASQPASKPAATHRRVIAGAQYKLISRGYYRGHVDGKYGRQTAFAIGAFQSSAGLPPTGRLEMETLDALGSSDADVAYSAPASRAYESWIPVTKFKHGKWKVKWKKYHRSWGGEDGDEDRQTNSEYGQNRSNED